MIFLYIAILFSVAEILVSFSEKANENYVFPDIFFKSKGTPEKS